MNFIILFVFIFCQFKDTNRLHETQSKIVDFCILIIQGTSNDNWTFLRGFG